MTTDWLINLVVLLIVAVGGIGVGYTLGWLVDRVCCRSGGETTDE